MKNNGLLFGGALMAAGLAAPQAVGDFALGSQPTGNYIGAAGGGGPFSINGFYDYSVTNDGYARAQASALSISGYATGGANELGYVLHFLPVPFQVTTDATATVSWDFTGDNDPGDKLIDSFITLDGPGGNLAFGDLNTLVGSVDISLLVGETYTFAGIAFAHEGTSQWSIVIPTPAAALPLLAAGGLLATRRRRRE